MKISDINNNDEGVLFDITGKKNLLVSFGGIQTGLGIPLFEFFNSISGFDCDKIFLRDYNQAWYHKGVDKNLTSPESIIRFLKKEIEAENYESVTFLGNSMGGYAAILFGSILNVNHTISFAPQTFISRQKRIVHFDRRWRKQMREIYKVKPLNTAYLDLKAHLLAQQDYKTQIHIYYANNYRLDKIHAERLAPCHNVILHSQSEGKHNVVKTIRDKGNLVSIIERTF